MQNKKSILATLRYSFAVAFMTLVGLSLLAVLLYQIPAVEQRFGWRVDFAMAYLRGVVDPVKPLPTALIPQNTILPATTGNQITPTIASTISPSPTPAYTATALPSPTPLPTAIPQKVELPAPEWEKQGLNNCGPTTLAMYLRFYGWKGNQETIASVIKPKAEDRNVNVEELVSYVNTEVPGLEIQYRVGGDLETLKRLVAAGVPVMIEETFEMQESYWPNDDRWAGHYLLITGYDDVIQKFITQDSFVSANMLVPYETLKRHWQSFNYVYILVYPLDSRSIVQSVLADQWDVQKNRQHAIDLSQQETIRNPNDAFAWFNLGTNYVFFENYGQAVAAYDKARNAGLPQRMLRYQFGPFFAYFNMNRIDDLLELADYALKITPTSEEAMLWKGWGFYRKGEKEEALKWFTKALGAHPGYSDATYALKFVQEN